MNDLKSFNANIDELIVYIDELIIKPDIIILTETWFSDGFLEVLMASGVFTVWGGRGGGSFCFR